MMEIFVSGTEVFSDAKLTESPYTNDGRLICMHSQSREPWFESSLCYRFEVWAFSVSPRRLRLSLFSCINEYRHVPCIDGVFCVS